MAPPTHPKPAIAASILHSCIYMNKNGRLLLRLPIKTATAYSTTTAMQQNAIYNPGAAQHAHRHLRNHTSHCRSNLTVLSKQLTLWLMALTQWYPDSCLRMRCCSRSMTADDGSAAAAAAAGATAAAGCWGCCQVALQQGLQQCSNRQHNSDKSASLTAQGASSNDRVHTHGRVRSHRQNRDR